MKNGDYILVKAPEWFKGKRYRGKYCYEHHLVWEKETGCVVPDGCIIHHKDHNKHNNSIENLQLMQVCAHASLHKKPKKMALLLCPCCRKTFTRAARCIPFRNINLCSRQCMGKYHSLIKKGERDVTKDKENNILKFFLE